jgi:hypothetical protein
MKFDSPRAELLSLWLFWSCRFAVVIQVAPLHFPRQFLVQSIEDLSETQPMAGSLVVGRMAHC